MLIMFLMCTQIINYIRWTNYNKYAILEEKNKLKPIE